MPKVTALMPLYNGREFIRESLESVRKQTFTDWEFLIVNDYGSDDGCADIVREYAEKDDRIILIQAKERLGLATSLNVGLDRAKGEYIARVDVDDPSEPERFAKEVAFMDSHPEISVCSCWQVSVTPDSRYVQEVAFEPDDLKAAMLFGCEICHCGAMLRKADFDIKGWRYDPSYLSEDYELWTRMLMEGVVFANIPEPLVSHRWGFGNISIAKGERLRTEVCMLSARLVRHIGVDTGAYSDFLYSGWRARPERYARKNTTLFLQQGYALLQELLEKNATAGYCSPAAMRKMVLRRWDWIRESCGLAFEAHPADSFENIRITPTVSVVLPAYNAAGDISRAIDSVQSQTYSDWEMLVVNDFGSNDGTAELVQMAALGDARIRLIEAQERLGLAESLNLGMREAKGEYIARLDADDTSMPERFAKQVSFLDKHPEVGICGTWQHHHGKDIDWVHEADPDPKMQRCRLLFWCDLCHSTLMLRREMFMDHELFYDPEAQAEDFELWTRAMEYMQIANIPEVLGEYSEGTGITANKVHLLADESGRITARTVKRILGVEVPDRDQYLLNGWLNSLEDSGNRERDLARIKEIFLQIWEKNESIGFFDRTCLLRVLAAKWHWIKDNVGWRQVRYVGVKNIEDVFSDRYKPSLLERYEEFKNNNPRVSIRLKKIIKRYILHPPAQFVRCAVRSVFRLCLEDVDKSVERWTWERFKQTDKAIENWTWKRYLRTRDDINRNTEILASVSFEQKRVALHDGEKIRIVFLFQIAPFWPSIDSFYQSVNADERFDTRLVCYDENIDPTIKVETARDYLKEHNIPYTPYEIFNIEEFNPHVVVLQTPYDTNRTKRYKTLSLKSKGYRVVYIPYGLEIGATEHSIRDQFAGSVIENCWRMYTLSERMILQFVNNKSSSVSVRALGLPKFDALYHPDKFPLASDIKVRAAGRKIVLWKVHFPKVIYENGEKIQLTPYISEYISFTDVIEKFQDLFFIFMPHPRFKEFNTDKKIQRELYILLNSLKGRQNVYIDDADDYRSSLINADCIIVDRSAVMVEAGAIGVPVLYMYNPDFQEPLTDAIRPLVESYYQGTSCADMEQFLEMFRRGEDPRKQEREEAFRLCVPYFDGKCGERIKEDIAISLEREQPADTDTGEQIWEQTALLRQQNAELMERIGRLEQSLAEVVARVGADTEQELIARIDKRIEHWTWDRYLRIKNWDNNQLKYVPRPRMRRLTVHITEHCNLNCRCCDNFSPIANEEYTDIASLERDLVRLYELSGGEIGIIELSGGEALLHPQICEFFAMIRRIFEQSDIQLLTNGILLQSMSDDFWTACRENKISIIITKYPIQIDRELIAKKAEENGVFWRYYSNQEVKTMNFFPLDVHGNQNGRVNFVNCMHANECIYLRNGRVYTCSVATNIHHYNRAFGEHLPDGAENSINIYEVKSMQEILSFLSNPIPLCDYCDVNERKAGLTWGTSSKDKSEWTMTE